jgi:hypothetical protein
LITSERTSERFFFRHRGSSEHHEVLLPPDAADRFLDPSILWNAAEAAEKRKDAQVAREIVLALPADAAINQGDRIELVRSFAERHFVAKGPAVQIDLHAPHHVGNRSETANCHAHPLITTRRVEGEALSAKKARDVEHAKKTAAPQVSRRSPNRGLLAERLGVGARIAFCPVFRFTLRYHITSMRTHPHAEATYRVVPLTGGAFGVEVVIPGAYPATVSSFATVAAAEAWIAQDKERVECETIAGKWFQKTR